MQNVDVKVALLSELPLASTRAVVAGELQILLIRNSAGVVSALEDRCSHADVRLSEGILEGEAVECPAHGAKFDVHSGRALCMPAIKAVKTFPVRTEADTVIVTVPDLGT